MAISESPPQNQINQKQINNMPKITAGIIDKVEPDSIASDLGWLPGDEIISVNGHKLSDIFDYQFYTADELVSVLLRRGDETAEFEIEKDIDDDLGVTFIDPLFDGIRTCGAKCVFCFVNQLPKGLRKPLYIKDDDYRLSFLHSNFVTLANVSDADLARIVQQRLTPLYVSVHTTNPALRESMLGRKAPSILHQIDTLTLGHITLHTQIVLCRGINDEKELDRTIDELAQRYPTVKSIAIVPAGLTSHRRHSTPIPPIDAQYSASILDNIIRRQHQFHSQFGTRLVWAADEFYLSALRPVPKASAYERFPQIGNGIGLVRKFKDCAYRAKAQFRQIGSETNKVRVSVATGQLAAPVLKQWAESVNSDSLNFTIFPIKNTLFGETVTVAGLISGKDIITQLRDKSLGDVLAIPSVALRDDAFLDDVTLREVEEALAVQILPASTNPTAFAGQLRRLIESK